jgi:hypothetical protein
MSPSYPQEQEAPLTTADDALVEPFIPTAAPAAAADSGPPPSSDAPGAVQEPQEQPGSVDSQPDEDPLEFDERYKEPFNGLMYLGYLEDSFVVWGHTFRIATPTQLEKIQAGALHQPYAESLASEIAYQTILVAAYLVSVDHTDLPRPVLNDPKENAVRDRFRWVAENLRPPVIDELFGRCMVLETKVGKVLRTMGEARG